VQLNTVITIAQYIIQKLELQKLEVFVEGKIYKWWSLLWSQRFQMKMW